MEHSDPTTEAASSEPVISREYVAALMGTHSLRQAGEIEHEIELNLYDLKRRKQGRAILPIPSDVWQDLEAQARNQALRSNLRVTFSVLPS